MKTSAHASTRTAKRNVLSQGGGRRYPFQPATSRTAWCPTLAATTRRATTCRAPACVFCMFSFECMSACFFYRTHGAMTARHYNRAHQHATGSRGLCTVATMKITMHNLEAMPPQPQHVNTPQLCPRISKCNVCMIPTSIAPVHISALENQHQAFLPGAVTVPMTPQPLACKMERLRHQTSTLQSPKPVGPCGGKESRSSNGRHRQQLRYAQGVCSTLLPRSRAAGITQRSAPRATAGQQRSGTGRTHNSESNQRPTAIFTMRASWPRRKQTGSGGSGDCPAPQGLQGSLHPQQAAGFACTTTQTGEQISSSHHPQNGTLPTTHTALVPCQGGPANTSSSPPRLAPHAGRHQLCIRVGTTQRSTHHQSPPTQQAQRQQASDRLQQPGHQRPGGSRTAGWVQRQKCSAVRSSPALADNLGPKHRLRSCLAGDSTSPLHK